MTRPENIKDIQEKDRFNNVGEFFTEHFITNPKLLKQYSLFCEAIQSFGGHLEQLYGSRVTIHLPKSPKQLEDQLNSDQYNWDEMQKLYNVALKGDNIEDPVPEWRREGLVRWAKQNDLPNPFDVFAANDEDLAQLRVELGLDDSIQ